MNILIFERIFMTFSWLYHILMITNGYSLFRIWGRNKTSITKQKKNSLTHADETTLMAENDEELKTLLMRVKEESDKAGLKLNFQKTKITASRPITSWQIEGVKVETMINLFSWAPKSLWTVTAAMKLKDICSLEEKLLQT